MARPAVGVRWGGEAYAAAQPAAERREQAVPRHLFERLEQEEQRLEKHDGRWMAIQQSLLVRQPFFKESLKYVENNIHPICHYF